MNFNQAIICGRVTRDPELRTTQNGKSVVSLGVATNKKIAGKEYTEFHNVVAWEKTAELVHQYLKKGSLVLVVGEIQTRSWEKDGVKHYRTEIVARDIQFGPKRSEEPQEPQPGENIDAEEINAKDIPF